MGSTVPPSIAMLLLGSITQITIGGLFIGGVVPAAVMAVCLMILIYFKARRANIPKVPRAPVREMVSTGLGAVLPLLMPVILFGGILTGAATPTEVASFAVVYGLVVAMLIYRVVDLHGLIRAAIDSALLTGMILFILGAATTFSWMLTIAMLPQRLVELLQIFGQGSSAIFLLGSMTLLIITGALLEGLPALNILAPMLVPLAGTFGLNELHYGMVLLIAMGVGVFSPPMGVGFYIACGVMRTPIEPAARAMIPYLIVLVIGLLIVAFVPWFTLFLPHAFGFRN
jgi:tripartite ATP-independent transporter DctM subunit